MKNGSVEVICGCGQGKTALAIGKGIEALTAHKDVIMIQFLKGCARKEEFDCLSVLEPGFKIFRFEKADAFFEKLTDQEKAEELLNIRNGFNFAKKVVATGECDLLILDEVLGIVNQNIVSMEEFKALLEAKGDQMCMVLTGMDFPEELRPYVDAVCRIEHNAVDKNRK